jgi:hypothetical protein
MPIVLAAVEAFGHPSVNSEACQVTTHSCAPLVMVSGPLADEGGVTSGASLFGPGSPANATIGRAVRLALQNVGLAYPGSSDRSAQGSPAKYTYCFGENEAESPWPPLRSVFGLAVEDSAVTVVWAEPPHNVNDHISDDPAGILLTTAQTIGTMGANNAYCRDSDYLVGFGPEHAAILGRAGWTRSDVQQYLYEAARIPFDKWRRGGMAGMLPGPRYLSAEPPAAVPMTDRPEDILVTTLGGPGRHSCWIPTAGMGRSHTQAITDATGAPLRHLQTP